MEKPGYKPSFEVWIDRFNPNEGSVVLNGLSRVSRLVDGFDQELTREELRHEKLTDENGEVTFKVHAKETQQFTPEYGWPAITAELAFVALKQEIDPIPIIRDPGHKTSRHATDITIIN